MNKRIEEFFQSKAIAIVGVSREKSSYSRILLTAFQERGYQVYIVNPNADEIDCVKCYSSISELPDEVEAVYILKRKELALDLAREAAIKGIKKIWIHIKCDSPDIKEISKEFGVSIIAGECFFMWAEPVKGVHKFHRFIREIFASSKEKD